MKVRLQLPILPAMIHHFLNKYTALSIGAQFVACLSVWILAFAISPAGDRVFGLMFNFYLPAIFLVSTVLNLIGEFGMIAAGIYGIAPSAFFFMESSSEPLCLF